MLLFCVFVSAEPQMQLKDRTDAGQIRDCQLKVPFPREPLTCIVYDMFKYYNMIVWIWAGNYISFTMAAGFIRLHMPGVKKSRV